MRTHTLSVVLVSFLLVVSGVGAVDAELTGSDAAPSVGVGVPAQASNIGGSPDLDVFAPNPNLVPGQINQITLQIANDGNLRFGNAANSDIVTTARNVRAEVEASGPLSVESGETSIGSVTTSTPGELPVSLNVPQGVEPGTYSLDLDLTYGYISSGESRTVTVSRDVEVRVRDEPRFRVVGIDSETQIGGTGTVEATIENVGTDPARDATVQFSSKSDELLLGTRSNSSRAFAGIWRPGSTQTFELTTTTTSDAVLREYPLSVQITYSDRDGVQRTSRELTTGVTPQKKQTFDVSNLSSTLYVGEPGTIRGTITNTGPVPVRNAVIVYTSSNPNIEPVDTEIALGHLAPTERGDFTFEANVADQATANNQQLNLTVRYRNAQGNQQTSDPLEPSVMLLPEREWLTVTPEQASFGIDTDNRMTVRIHNDGQVPLTDIQARLEVEVPFSTESQLAYVQQLSPGETATLAFEVTTSEDAVATQSLVTLNITSDRPDEKEIAETYLVPVTVEEETDASNTTIFAAAGLIALVVLAGGWWWIRK